MSNDTTDVRTVSGALAKRASVRGYTDRKPPEGLIRELVERAARAPSGGNLQPWHIYVVEGAAKDRVIDRVAAARAANPMGNPPYDIYPPKLTEPYRTRRFEVGEDLYGALGIERADKMGRAKWFEWNYRFFDAPVGLFCYVDKQMSLPQWSDCGMYLQSLMLLLVEHGLASCPQECWALFPDAIADVLNPPDKLMLFTGMAIGYENPEEAANTMRSRRAPLAEYATFLRD